MQWRLVVVAGSLNLLLVVHANELQAQTAFVASRDVEPIAHFHRGADGSDRDLVTRGILSYTAGDYNQAIALLERVFDRARYPESRLYLALSHLLIGNDRRAAEELTAYRDVAPTLFIAAQIGRALAVIRLDPLSDRMRDLIAVSLETEVERDRRLRQERFAQRFRSRVFPPMP